MHDAGWWTFIRFDEQRDRPSISRAVLGRVAGYAKPYRGRIVLMLLTILAITGTSLVPPLLYRELIDRALPERNFTLLNLLAFGMIGVPIVSGLFGVLQRYLSAQIGEGIIHDLRRALFDHLQQMSLRFFTNTKTGELMSRLNSDVVGAQQAITSTLVSTISNVVALVGTLAIMLSLEWRLTIAAIVILPLFVIPARRVGRVLRGITREGFVQNAQMNALMNETLNVNGALLVKLFGRAPQETARFGERAAAVRDIGVRQALVGRWFFLALSLVSAIGTAVVFWFGGYLVLSEGLTIGTIVAFGSYLTQLYGPLSAITNARVELATSLVSFERVFEVLDLPLEVTDRSGAVTLEQVAGNVIFDDVSFSYLDANVPAGLSDVERYTRRAGSQMLASGSRMAAKRAAQAASNGAGQNGANGADESSDGETAGETTGETTVVPTRRWALEHVSFEVKPGQLAALVGPSGAGKTTITYLLPRLYDPTAGRVLVDGHDIRDVTHLSLAEQVGMVTQEAYLFHDTIRANLLYAKPDATQAELEIAARAANILELIASLPEGFDTVVGERGYRLSGGEKQRLALARVILKNPRILVLDEATAHLDSQSEALIQTALVEVMRGRTSLVIAHRLSTILAADVILVLDRGRLVESGTHAELLARGGLYADLYHTQYREQVTAQTL